MKKWLLASSLVFGISTVVALPTTIQAHAKEVDMTASFAAAIKKGTMPNAQGKLNITYSALKKKTPDFEKTKDEGLVLYRTDTIKGDQDVYVFDAKKFSSKSKAIILTRYQKKVISDKSLKKYFGKPETLNANDKVYTVGKNYLFVSKEKKETYLFLATKKGFDLLIETTVEQ